MNKSIKNLIEYFEKRLKDWKYFPEPPLNGDRPDLIMLKSSSFDEEKFTIEPW